MRPPHVGVGWWDRPKWCARSLSRRNPGSGLIHAKRPGEDAFVKSENERDL
jgi:hypothetical protein